MAKKSKTENPQTIKSVEETLTRTEQFLEQNYKSLLIVLGVFVIAAGIIWLSKIYLGKRDDEAKSQMYQAERYLEMDSLRLALNGDGNYLGFLDIADSYKFTSTGNLARYSAGICYLHLGEFELAIEMLSGYKTKDKVLSSLATGAIGDALIETGEISKGVDKYLEAADMAENSFNTPLFLMKAGEIYELEGDYKNALSIYQRIKDEYPESTEGNSIDKYIARINILAGSQK